MWWGVPDWGFRLARRVPCLQKLFESADGFKPPTSERQLHHHLCSISSLSLDHAVVPVLRAASASRPSHCACLAATTARMMRPKPTSSSLGVTLFTGPPCRSLGHAPDCLLGSIGPRLRPWGPNGPVQRANQPFTSCVGALCGVKTLQGAESKQGEEGNQEKKEQAARYLRPNQLKECYVFLAFLESLHLFVASVSPCPGLECPFTTPSESGPAYVLGKGTNSVGPTVHALLSLARFTPWRAA